MDESTVSEPSEPAPHLEFQRHLIERIRENIKRSHAPYNKTVANIDWDKVAFDGHSAAECRERWADIQSRLRVHRTLPELLDDAEASRWDPTRLRKAKQMKLTAEGAPTKPLSAFLLFCQHIRPKVVKKHPDMSSSELMALMSKKYAAASDAKKESYRLNAATALAEYKEQMAVFEREHPELRADQPPKRPRSARELYVGKHPEVPRAEAIAAYKALSADEKSVYIRKAQRALKKFAKAVEAYQERYPGWKAPTIATDVPKDQRKILEEVDGVVRKPRRPYDLFRVEIAPQLDSPKKRRLQTCAEMWRAADAATKQRFRELADREKAEYLRHLQTLTPEERESLEKKHRPKARATKRKRVTAKQLFLQEKMPTTFETLSEPEWQRILTRKFAKLSQQDKDLYTRRAAELNQTESQQDAAADSAASSSSAAAAAAASGPRLNGGSPSRTSSAWGGRKVATRPPRLQVQAEPDGAAADEPDDEVTPPRSLGRARHGQKRQATDADEIEVHDSSDLTLNGLDSTGGGDSSATHQPPSPGQRAMKRSRSVSESDTEGAGETQAKRKGGLQELVEDEEDDEDPPCTPYEFFIQKFRPKSMEGVTPKKLKKLAKKAWNALSEEQLRRVERRYARLVGSDV